MSPWLPAVAVPVPAVSRLSDVALIPFMRWAGAAEYRNVEAAGANPTAVRFLSCSDAAVWVFSSEIGLIGAAAPDDKPPTRDCRPRVSV
jgi:hypothetical protein